jgi:hypothetical protein
MKQRRITGIVIGCDGLKHLEKICLSVILFTMSHTWIGLGLRHGLCNENFAANHLICGMALYQVLNERD